MSAMSATILVIDDHPANLKLAEVLLQLEGYAVQTAQDAEKAMELLKTLRPQVILMDLQLPGMDGLELTRLIKAAPETRHIAIIALTAYAMKGDEEKALAAGCDAYLSKPTDSLLLKKVVAAQLARPIEPKER